MEAIRSRLSFNLHALATGAWVASLFLVALLAAREFRVAPWAVSPANRLLSSTTAAVPAEAVSVPALILGAASIRVGDRVADALGHLTGSVRFLDRVEERGPLGTREVRSYQRADMDFILVLEPFERGGEPRVAAIYLK